MTNLQIDYKKPIFVYYINIEGLSRQRAEEEIQAITDNMLQQDVQMWFVPCGSRPATIECVYPGMKDAEFNDRMKALIDKMISILDGFMDGSSKDDIIMKLKMQVKDILIDGIING
jgi:hypothetical protein